MKCLLYLGSNCSLSLLAWDIVFLEDVNKRLSSLEEKLSTFSDYFLYDHTSNTAVSVEHEGLSIIGKKSELLKFAG